MNWGLGKTQAKNRVGQEERQGEIDKYKKEGEKELGRGKIGERFATWKIGNRQKKLEGVGLRKFEWEGKWGLKNL